MNDAGIHAVVSVLLAIAGLAVVAVLVSNQAQTGSVLGAGGSSVGNALACAVSPITGGGCGASVTSTISFGAPTGSTNRPACGNSFTSFACI